MSNHISTETRNAVARRANFVCEYCLIAETDAYFKFQIEHIISRKLGGTTDLKNLASSFSPENGELFRFCFKCDKRSGLKIIDHSRNLKV